MLREKREHPGPQLALLDDDLDEVGAGRPLPHDAHDIAIRGEEQGLERPPDGAHRRGLAQIDVVMDFMRHIVDGEQLALVAHLDRHHLGAEVVENLLDDVLGQLEFLRLARDFGRIVVGVEHDRDRARDRDAIGKPVEAKLAIDGT